MKYQIGLVGLGVMGRNLALNMERNGFSVCAFDIDDQQRKKAMETFTKKKMRIVTSYNDLLSALEQPRKIMMMVPAGKAVDAVIDTLAPMLEPGDLLIDGGNSHFLDTERRYKQLKEKGILYVGTGVSGGEEGALYGPSLMPGGDPQAWPLIEDLFKAIAAKTEDGAPCAAWIGEGGAGHFVKMVHNGIEYGDMQMICESYFLMKQLLQMSAQEMSAVFQKWNEDRLNSYLISITAEILSKTDPETGRPMVDVILDTAGQKGTGKWTSQAALDFGVPAPTIAEAVFARFMSALKEERIKASKIIYGPQFQFKEDKKQFIDDLEQALYASKICSYAQGFQLMKAANDEFNWNLDLANIAQLWQGGCIIRAKFLSKIEDTFRKIPELDNLVVAPYFTEVLQQLQTAWRKVISTAALAGVPTPALSSALAYFDSYRSEQLPANLLQAQRDYFGAHTFERVDRPRGQFFHFNWQQNSDPEEK